MVWFQNFRSLYKLKPVVAKKLLRNGIAVHYDQELRAKKSKDLLSQMSLESLSAYQLKVGP